MIIYKLNTVPRYEVATVVVHANEGEYGGTWKFEIKDGDSDFNVINDPSVMINICKADKNVYSNAVPYGIDDTGHVEVTIEEQMTASPGKAIAELVFMESGMRKATANFIIDVERSPVSMGEESDSLINYVERSKEAVEEATTALQEATNAAQSATQAAETAAAAANASAEDVAGAVEHIEAMPTTLQTLASTLATAGSANTYLGFDTSGTPSAFDTGFVTPQMYGAKGNGTTNDATAFRNAIASGKKVVIPPASYRLNSIIWTDDSVVISDAGTYTNKPLIVSRNLRNSAPIERFITQINTSESNARDYRLQAGCYDSTRDRFILSFCMDYSAIEDNTDLVLTAYDSSWNPVSGMSKVITGGGHGNAICYNPNTDKIYSICGNGDHQIAVINAADLTFDSWLDPVSESRPWQIAYDVDNDIYYIHFSVDSTPQYRAYNASFTPLSKTFPIGASDVINIGKLHYGNDGLNIQASVVIDGQLLQVLCGSRKTEDLYLYASNGAHLVQYNYQDGTPKKVYRVTTLYQTYDEPQCLISANGRIFMVSDTGDRAGQHLVSVSQLVFDERVVGESDSPYKDARLLSAADAPKNLNNALSIGCYVAQSMAVVETLTNAPCEQPFNLYVIPSPTNGDSRTQIAINSRGEIFTRSYYANGAVWYGWRQLAETPRSGASRGGSWTGTGYVTSGGKEIRFTLPLQTRTISSQNPAVTVESLSLSILQGGSYILDNVDVANASGYTVSAAANAFGINIIVTASNGFTGVTNNAPIGVKLTIAMSYE